MFVPSVLARLLVHRVTIMLLVTTELSSLRRLQRGGSKGNLLRHTSFDPCEMPSHTSIREAAETAQRSAQAFKICNVTRIFSSLSLLIGNRAKLNGLFNYMCVGYRLSFAHLYSENCGERQKNCSDTVFIQRFRPKFVFLVRYAFTGYLVSYSSSRLHEFTQILEKCGLALQTRSISSSLHALRWIRSNVLDSSTFL